MPDPKANSHGGSKFLVKHNLNIWQIRKMQSTTDKKMGSSHLLRYYSICIYMYPLHTGAKSYFLSINSLEFDIWDNVTLVKNNFLKMRFLWKLASNSVIFVKNTILKMWFLFKNMNFAKNAILKMWMSWIM